jgi:hypothetical protein
MKITTTLAIILFVPHAHCFAASAEAFPPDGRLPDGWFKPASASRSWKVSDSVAYEGAKSLMSDTALTDGKTAAVAYRSNFKAGKVTFRLKVSSEQGYDFARFFIDGVPQMLATKGKKDGLSGNVDWQLASFQIPAGMHTLLWTYEKDDAYATGVDAAWLDAVTLPETTQEIAVKDSEGKNIASGLTTTSFPEVDTDSTSAPLTFTIKNAGHAPLFNLKVSLTGVNAAEFKVTPLKGSSLEEGETSTFSVVFAPQSIGQKAAGILITSNDKDESNFTIDLKAKGIGLPLIGASTSSGAKLQDNGKVIGFGNSAVGVKGGIKIFKVTNYGTADLKNLKISRSGKNGGDFVVSELGTKVLSPGDTTTFKVTFKPTGSGNRSGVIHIASSDKKSGPFDINLSGTGTSKKSSSATGAGETEGIAAAVFGAPAATARPAASVEIVDGRKYLTVTVTKPLGARTVEVSPNLVDWYSGENHTTVVIDNATTLKVRDNTPVTQESKRYIRIR